MHSETEDIENITIASIEERHRRIISEIKRIYPEFSALRSQMDYSEAFEYADHVLGSVAVPIKENRPIQIIHKRIQAMQRYVNVMTASAA